MAGRGEGVGVVLAEDSAAAGEGVVLELPGLLIVTQRPQEQAEVAGRGEGVGVVVAEDSAPPAQHLFLQFPGLRVVTQPEQVVGELAGGGEGVGVRPRRGFGGAGSACPRRARGPAGTHPATTGSAQGCWPR